MNLSEVLDYFADHEGLDAVIKVVDADPSRPAPIAIIRGKVGAITMNQQTSAAETSGVARVSLGDDDPSSGPLDWRPALYLDAGRFRGAQAFFADAIGIDLGDVQLHVDCLREVSG